MGPIFNLLFNQNIVSSIDYVFYVCLEVTAQACVKFITEYTQIRKLIWLKKAMLITMTNYSFFN